MQIINRKIHNELLKEIQQHFEEIFSNLRFDICEIVDTKIRSSIQDGNIAYINWCELEALMGQYQLPNTYYKELLVILKTSFPDYKFKESWGKT